MVRALSKINIPFKVHKDSDKVTKNLFALRTILQASQKDVRILCIKLADRFHNMITLGGKKSEESKRRIAKETLDIYIPLARRVGMWFFYQSMKYLSYQYIYTDKIVILRQKYEAFEPTQREVTQKLSKELHASASRANLVTCESTFRDVFKRELVKAPEFLEPEDFFLFHITVASDKDVFFLLSELGSCSSKIALSSTRDKNFIAHVKSSGYQAYHTTIIFEGKYRIRLRIQSEEMHKQTR